MHEQVTADRDGVVWFGLNENIMKFALIKNNKVENIIIADDSFIQTIQSEWDATVELQEGALVSLGWEYVSGEFKVPDSVTPEVQVPSSVKIRQIKLALLKANKLSAVPSAISSLPSPKKEEVEIEWQYATDVQRNGFIVSLLEALQITPAEGDNLFIQASTL